MPDRLTKTVTTAEGLIKVIISVTQENLAAAVVVTQNETRPKGPDIRNKSDGNKFYKDFN